MKDIKHQQPNQQPKQQRQRKKYYSEKPNKQHYGSNSNSNNVNRRYSNKNNDKRYSGINIDNNIISHDNRYDSIHNNHSVDHNKIVEIVDFTDETFEEFLLNNNSISSIKELRLYESQIKKFFDHHRQLRNENQLLTEENLVLV